jgi:hypothetical protein
MHDLRRAALVYGAVALGRLLERQSQVEDLARVDLFVPRSVVHRSIHRIMTRSA